MRGVDSPDAQRVVVCQERRDRGFVLQTLNARELRGERPQSLALELGFIHKTAKEIANLAPTGVGRRRRVIARRILNQCPQRVLLGVVERGEYADLGFVRGNLRRLEPRAVDVAVEVVLGANVRIQISKIDAGACTGH